VPRFRLSLLDRERAEIEGTEFDATDALSGLKVAHRIFEAYSDACAGYVLLEGDNCIASTTATAGTPHIDLNELEQKTAVATEIALAGSNARLRESMLLLASLADKHSAVQSNDHSAKSRDRTPGNREHRPIWLSDRERQCAQLVARGDNDREIAQKLGLSERTVNEYMDRVKRKLDAHSRMEAIVLAVKSGLIE
jgi:DNA-binding CsgD family transcriptional regulator